MNRRMVKKKVLQQLAQGNVETIVDEFAGDYSPALVNSLFSALCAPSEAVRWQAVVCFGKVVPLIAARDMEAARVIMRRFLWSLNDESGGIGWGAPEAMAEIMARHEGLAEEYLHMLISYLRHDGPQLFEDGNFLELPMLQRGLLWGIGRLCATRRDLLLERGVAADIPQYLTSEDMVVRGLAVWCLTELGTGAALEEIKDMARADVQVPIFRDGNIHTSSLAQLIEGCVRAAGSAW